MFPFVNEEGFLCHQGKHPRPYQVVTEVACPALVNMTIGGFMVVDDGEGY